MNPTYRKLLYICLWYIVYPNVLLLLLAQDLFFKTENFIFLATLLLTYGIGIIDTIIRPFSESIQEDATINPLYSLIMIVIFLLHPVIVAVSFYESKYLISEYLPLWRNLFVSLFGIFILMVGGFITISGRYQLKNFGEGIL
ncbi:MAG: hypothetical protein ACFFAM_15900, partial [Promethearchaeota archaeon]